MGLIRGVARTAVVAGTATATANAVNRRQARRNAEAYQQQPQYAQTPPVQAPPEYAAQTQAPSGAMTDQKLAQLSQLGQLKSQGILSEAEFEQQKASILSS
jgi:hypothetical protein